MKQINSVIASILVSGLLVLGIAGIGVNALTNTSAATASTTSAGVTINSSNARFDRHSERRGARVSTGFTNDDPNPFTQ